MIMKEVFIQLQIKTNMFEIQIMVAKFDYNTEKGINKYCW